MENILMIGAHYDDVELGAGGTAAKLAKEGKNVYKLTLTDNVTKSALLNLDVVYETSLEESGQACEVLGIKEISPEEFKPLPCTYLEYNTETMQNIEEIIHKYNIDTVFMHFMHDMNQDHIAASKLCLTAARHCKTILAYQSNMYIYEDKYYPTLFFDISDTIDLKRESLFKYTGDHNRNNKLFEMNMKRNEVWGYSNLVEYAEGFHVVKMLVE